MPPIPPALQRDHELRETVDLLAQVTATMSARIDAQGKKLDALITLMAETRDAAVTARDHTDPERYGRFIGQEIHTHLDPVLDRLARSAGSLRHHLGETSTRLKELETAEKQVLDRLRNELSEVEKWRTQRRWVCIGVVAAGVILGLVATLLTGG